MQVCPPRNGKKPQKRKRGGDESSEYSGSSTSSEDDDEANAQLKKNFEKHTSDEEGKVEDVDKLRVNYF